MSERIEIRPAGIKPRQIDHVVGVLVRGGLIAYPTDSGYAFGWRASSRAAADRVIRIRQLDRQHHFTYCCRSLSEVAQIARVNNANHRMIRQLAPGPFTFVLPATRNIPRAARIEQRQTIGVRIPDHPVVDALLEALDEPLLSSSLLLPDGDEEIYDTEDLFDATTGLVDLFVDAGACPLDPTTLLDLTGEHPVVLRQGGGRIEFI